MILRSLCQGVTTPHLSHERWSAAASGAALTLWNLLEAGWPGERPLPDAGANRVYVAAARRGRTGARHLSLRPNGVKVS